MTCLMSAQSMPIPKAVVTIIRRGKFPGPDLVKDEIIFSFRVGVEAFVYMSKIRNLCRSGLPTGYVTVAYFPRLYLKSR